MTNNLHILLLTHSYTPEDTAPQRRWSGFTKYLVAVGYDVSVVAPQPDPGQGAWKTETGDHGERIYRVPGAQSAGTRTGRLLNNILGSLATIPRALRVKNVDIVIATVPALTTAPTGLLVSLLKRRPLILEMRDAWPDLAHDAQLPMNLLRKTMEAVLEYTQRKADAVITVTQGFAALLRKRGISNVRCIPNGLSDDILQVTEHPGVLRHEKLQVLYVGNHGESQGLETLLSAAALAAKDIDMTLVGTGTQKNALISLAEDLQAPATFLDPCSGADLQVCYEAADTCIVSLRPDWPSFLRTVPSKTYELLALGRKLTAVLKGEAAELVKRYQPDSVVAADPTQIAAYWAGLKENPEELVVSIDPEFAVQASPRSRTASLIALLKEVVQQPRSHMR
ncbi:glycosyltransferase family 4 protein [Micrococcoides hystricis]|uniref:D-inositol 3-phosphate glycosyltransferase n=1 Tax=Micrococcoides hystricis TaxID=1572761 RepID=A0ABV6PE58_9MICC